MSAPGVRRTASRPLRPLVSAAAAMTMAFSFGGCGLLDYLTCLQHGGCGRPILKWGGPGSGNGQFDRPTGIATARSGDVYVVDQKNYRVQRFGPGGTTGASGAAKAGARACSGSRTRSPSAPRARYT